MATDDATMRSGASKSILVIFPGALGDLICLIPALRALARHHQGSALELMARAELARFATGRLGVGHGHSIDRRAMVQLFTTKREAEIDITERDAEIDVEARIYFSMFRHVYSFFASEDENFRAALDAASGGRASYFPFRPRGGGHVAAAYLREIGAEISQKASAGAVVRIGKEAAVPLADAEVTAAAGMTEAAAKVGAGCAEVAEAAALDCSFELDREDLDRAEERLARLGLEVGRYMLVLPGSGSAAKNWPAENFVALATALDPRMRSLVVLGPAEAALKPVFLAGPREVDRTAHPQIREKVERGSHGPAVVGNLDLAEVAALARLSRCFVGNDSGISHLAAAAGARGLAIFGPTDPARWRPLGRTTVIRREPLSALTVEEVAAAILEIIG
jgi:ADP-heptose:LPS heptosyltransferase